MYVVSTRISLLVSGVQEVFVVSRLICSKCVEHFVSGKYEIRIVLRELIVGSMFSK